MALPAGARVLAEDVTLFAPLVAAVATSQTETSTSYDDMATVGPSVTCTVGPSGIIEVTFSAQISNAGGNHAYMSFVLSGANTLAADDARSIHFASTNVFRFSGAYLLTGLTPGSTVVTAKYRVSANTGTFANRSLHVKTF